MDDDANRRDQQRPQELERHRIQPPDQRWHRVQFDQSAFNSSALLDDDDDNDELKEPLTLVPRAFKETPAVRHSYLRAVLDNVFNKVPVHQASATLCAMLDNLSIVNALPDFPRPVRSLLSAKCRLGIDPDQHIIKYAVCPECWKHYHPLELKTLDTPICAVDYCSGTLYDDWTNAKGQRVRKPRKMHPQVSIIESLRRMFMRPGFANMIRDSRADVPNRNHDKEFIMKDMHDGSLWHELDTHTVREVSEHGHVRDRPEDGRETAPKLSSHRFGLVLTMNVDWMGVLENRPHSTGAMYFAINNLPRDQRFLQINVICASVMPGPKEPDVRQISHCMEPSAREVNMLRSGVSMDVYDEEEPANVYADCACLDCDMPASHKCNGTASHSHDMQPCLYCDATVIDINSASGYDNSRTPKDDYELLRQALYSKDAPPARQDQILDDHGARFVTLDLIPGWLPKTKTVLDFMHCVYLGIIPHLYDKVLFGGYMITGLGGSDSAKQRFESLINSIAWPSHITRLPKNVLLSCSPPALVEILHHLALWFRPLVRLRFYAPTLRSVPPTSDPSEVSELFRSLEYRPLSDSRQAVAAVRILSSREISMSQARTGQSFLAQYCQRLLALDIRLRPNHHAAMHTADIIQLFGPVYAWWLFAFERFNGMLERVKHNGHDGGQMELTLMRAWVQTHLIYEYLVHLPPNAHEVEHKALDTIIKTQAHERGAMMTQIAIYQSEATEDNIRLPKRTAKFIDLRMCDTPAGLYRLLLSYCSRLWPNLRLVSDRSCDPGTTPFVSHKVARKLTYIRKDGIRYGYGDLTRVPVRIHSLFVVGVGDKAPHVCAVVERLLSDDNVPELPWSMFASTLGVYVCYADMYAPIEVIPASSIQCSIALIPISLRALDCPLVAAVSFDHVGTEPEEFFD
ncbi:hypothetical protein CONPUDRAFT_61597 [Coniophora puteana RWD-64-598 SS2]|uniref:Uncharacterized protein n=1 Tax=Coniophora puteana (strain RWD-64-598) TaxID=741705 RepID=A0A5M3MFX9_CONPW|nr:uncharacterized protein CONPUDRAFT_61597 [Coniophora puteana RWD-64-598 SS2]EIW77947.1 hypothetical protein CONPUDRAFT_61597 [Coniophora puteana RWD-64-598 SS2]